MTDHILPCMILLLLRFYTAGAWGLDAYPKEDFPDPRKNFIECGQENTSSICDPRQSLTKLEVQELSSLIKSLQGGCFCDEFALHCNPLHVTKDQIMIAIVPRIKESGGKSSETNKTQIQLTQEFAEYLRDRRWMAADKRCAVHIIIVVNLNTTTMWTAATQYGRKVNRDSYFITGNVFGGLTEIITEYKTHLDQVLPFLEPCIRWRLAGIVISFLLVVYGIGYCYSKRSCREDGAGNCDWTAHVWRVSRSEVVMVVAVIAVVEVVGMVVGTAAVWAVVGAAVANNFRAVFRTLVAVVVHTAIVMVLASAVGIMVAVPLEMIGTVEWHEVFGAAGVMVTGKVIVIGVAVGVGVFGAAVLEVFKAVGAAVMDVVGGTAVVAVTGVAVMLVVGGTAVVAGWGAAKMMEVVVQAAEWKLPGQLVGYLVWVIVWGDVNKLYLLLMVLVVVVAVIVTVVWTIAAVMVSSVKMRCEAIRKLWMWMLICMLVLEVTLLAAALMLGVMAVVVMLAVLVVQAFGVVVGIVLVMVLGTVVAATIVVPRRLSNIDVVEKVVPTVVVVQPVEVIKAPEVGAVKAVVIAVITTALVSMLVAWAVVVFKVYLYLLVSMADLTRGNGLLVLVFIVMNMLLVPITMMCMFAGLLPTFGVVIVAERYGYI